MESAHLTTDDPHARETLDVLICDDNTVDTDICLRELRRNGYEPVHKRVQNREEFAAALRSHDWSVVLSDYKMPTFSAMQALKILRERSEEIPFIVVTGSIDEDTAVNCIKQGATDYILKDNPARLGPAVRAALEAQRERGRRLQLEAGLRQAQKLEAVGRLAAGIAHDFNNMLQVMHGHADLIGCSPDLESAKASAREIQSATRRASRLTSRLLACGRRNDIVEREVIASRVVAGLEELLRRSTRAGIHLHIDTTPTQPSWLDPDQLEQTIVNLALNAVDAMPNGGTLTIETKPVEIRNSDARRMQLEPGSFTRIRVRDTGIGIGESIRERIFEPFFTTKGVEKGSGLGLSTTYAFVRQSGGAIEVDSEPGQGSTFTIYFPSSGPPVDELPGSNLAGDDFTNADSSSTTGAARRVLIIEDEPMVRTTVVRTLTSHSIDTVEAETPKRALEIFDTDPGRFDVVLCDVALPTMSGIELCARLALRNPNQRFVLMSGNADGTRDRFKDLDNATFLPKPFGQDDLLRALREPPMN